MAPGKQLGCSPGRPEVKSRESQNWTLYCLENYGFEKKNSLVKLLNVATCFCCHEYLKALHKEEGLVSL